MLAATATSGFHLVSAEVKELTPELADQFRNLEASPTERALDESRVRHLQEKAEAGQLVTFNWSTAKLGERTLRMNGQHSSKMLCDLNGNFPKGLKVHLDTYEVDSPAALAILFRQFDDRKSGRTPGDVSGAYQGLYSDLHDVARASAKLAAEGVAYYRTKVEGLPAPNGDDRYSLFGEIGLHGFVRWIGELITIKTPELKRPTIVAAMFGTFSKNENEARKFWAEVARGGVEYEDNHPTTVLDAWLKTAIENKGQRRELKPAHFYQSCVFAWNAYRDGKTITSIKFDTKKGLLAVNE
jgi:hypothetical protein